MAYYVISSSNSIHNTADDALNGELNFAQRLEIFDQSGALIHTIEFRDAVSIRQ